MTETVDIAHLAEEIETVARRSLGTHRIVIVVPLREDVREVASEFLAEGPPFDPKALGLGRHEVFLTDREVVFVFESEDSRAQLERVLRESEFWTVLKAWEHLVVGQPRVGTMMYEWPERRRAAAGGPS